MGLDSDFGFTPQPPPITADGQESITNALIEDLTSLSKVKGQTYKKELEDTIADLLKRREGGISKYGVELTTFNGRNPKIDLYQELLDALVYCKQILMERSKIGDPGKTGMIFAEIHYSIVMNILALRSIITGK